MNVLLVGAGGREHALATAIARSPRLDRLYNVPGNAGTAALGENLTVDSEDPDALAAAAHAHDIDLTVVGPEAPLCAGLVDRFTEQGLRVFGPSQAAARIEGDKAFSKELMRRARVPTAEARIFDDFEAAHTFVATRDCALVVKATGLAAGKGVIVCDDPSEALLALEAIMVDGKFGDAGRMVVVEERLQGREVSVLALVDGTTIYLLETAQDYKKIGAQDTGPNTGGMGAISPAPLVDEEFFRDVESNVFVPVIDALRADGITYRGVLYAGLMLTAAGPKVLEFNCRFGDPEAQVILPRIQSDVLQLLNACASGRLIDARIKWDPRTAVCVVMASEGYPGKAKTGHIISGLEDAAAMDNVAVYHAGTTVAEGHTVTAGGRVLGVTGLADDVAGARDLAYRGIGAIHFDGAYFRSDIAEPVPTAPRT